MFQYNVIRPAGVMPLAIRVSVLRLKE